MITKEDARLMYNLYAQIETSEEIIGKLEEFVKTQDAQIPDIIDKSYHPHGSIEIHIPYFEAGKFDRNRGSRVFNISYKAALRVLKNHVRNLKKQVKEMNENLLKGGNQ